MKDVASKHIDGISDLVLIAPIKEGFIEAFDNITYATRLKRVAEALNQVRVTAREHERIVPYTDVSKRILDLLDFRIGVLDKDMFGLSRTVDAQGKVQTQIKPQRYLYLTATFDGGWEPYMRLIWKPLGVFLDLLFCNCEGYVTASDHACDEYLQWVRDNQMDSAIFYNTTGLTVRDQEYLVNFEKKQRAGHSDLDLAQHTMPYPDESSAAVRQKYPAKAIELGLEALTVLYKLADFYPPEWMTGDAGNLKKINEGHRLFRVAKEILRGWDELIAPLNAFAAMPSLPPTLSPQQKTAVERWIIARDTYADPLNWYDTGKKTVVEMDEKASVKPDPRFDRREIQAGIIKAIGSAAEPVQQGALLLFTVQSAADTRDFIKGMMDRGAISFEGSKNSLFSRTLSFTPQGLLQLGLKRDVLEQFPKEFREGLAARSGLVGDMRENHPRNWILPERNGPALTGAVPEGTKLPPVELDEVDFVLQVRSASPDRTNIEAEVKRLAAAASKGATLEAVDWLYIHYDDETGLFRDHFGYLDGISQPKPVLQDQPAPPLARDHVKAGEILLGYGNDRSDGPPDDFDRCNQGAAKWRKPFRRKALNLQFNGSYLVIRKIGEEAEAFDGWLNEQAVPIASQLGIATPAARNLLAAAIMGRDEKGAALAQAGSPKGNDFDYGGDQSGLKCPHAAHIRRANPRRISMAKDAKVDVLAEFGRPTPRLVRRGMLFGEAGQPQGLMFMAYNASLAEQYEIIQRWLNGGNSTDVASANNDPLTGVQPAGGVQVFRFVAQNTKGVPVVLRVPLPEPVTPDNRGNVPGRHPFTPLHWGLYLFAPSRNTLDEIANPKTGPKSAKDRTTLFWDERYMPMREMKDSAIGRAWLDKLSALTRQEAAKEWKRLLEDFDAKDPAEADISPHLWAAIRTYYGGAIHLTSSTADEGKPHDWLNPDVDAQNMILCCGRTQVLQVLADWRNFTMEEQLRRIVDNSGPIYVTQQPDDVYFDKRYQTEGLTYHSEAVDTNAILMDFSEEEAYNVGYLAGKAVLDAAKAKIIAANDKGAAGKRDYFKIELRRQYLLPAIARVWKAWYGLPDGKNLFQGGWSWKRIVKTIASDADKAVSRTQALCPGDFLSPSRYSFYPRPSEILKQFADTQGKAILDGGKAFVKDHRANQGSHLPPLSQKLFAAIKNDDVLARNIIGTMIGAIPPMDANLRNILFDWLIEKSLWRHQAAMKRSLGGALAVDNFDTVNAILRGPLSQAICKRPAPDLLYRTAKKTAIIPTYDDRQSEDTEDVVAKEGDMVIVSLVSATQRSLLKPETPDGDISIVFGGNRICPTQGYLYESGQACNDPMARDDHPVHACPAQKMAMGAMIGIVAALLDAGTIQALPASLIVKINGWLDD